jgi:hypothetical protein
MKEKCKKAGWVPGQVRRRYVGTALAACGVCLAVNFRTRHLLFCHFHEVYFEEVAESLTNPVSFCMRSL